MTVFLNKRAVWTRSVVRKTGGLQVLEGGRFEGVKIAGDRGCQALELNTPDDGRCREGRSRHTAGEWEGDGRARTRAGLGGNSTWPDRWGTNTVDSIFVDPDANGETT